MSTTYKVWPLVPGLRGLNALGEPIELIPGIAAWMDEKQAKEEEMAGRVQLMVGLTPQDLRTPTYETAAATPESAPGVKSNPAPRRPRKRGRGIYGRRDMAAEQVGE